MAATVLTSQDANWDLERLAFNIVFDQQPAGIAVPRSADEVSDVVRTAAAEGKRVAGSALDTMRRPSVRLPTPCCAHRWP